MKNKARFKPAFRRKRREAIQEYSACFYCGVVDPRMTVDHLTPTSRGGSNGRTNLRPACRPCNLAKGARTLEEYREVVQKEKGRETWLFWGEYYK